MSRSVVWTCLTLGVSLMSGGVDAGAPQFVPPAGYSDNGKTDRPGVVVPAEPGTPMLRRVPDASLSTAFKIDAAYARKVAAEAAATPDDHTTWSRHDAAAQVKVVGAFAVAEPRGTRLVAAWAWGFLPVTLAFSDGKCFNMSAEYEGGTLSNGRLNRVGCEHRPYGDRRPPPPPPPDRRLRLVNSAWGLQAWANDQAGLTTVTVPDAKTFQPLFTAKMATIAAMPILSIDSPYGNITLVGRIGGRLMVVTLEFSY